MSQAMSSSDYHGGTFADRPALSQSIIKLLLNRSPAHAWAAHPRLNPNYVSEEKAVFDRGSAAHALFLEDDDTGVVVLDFDDYRTKAAKEARDYARSLGQIPMLQKHWDDVQALVEGMRDGISAIKASPPLFQGGKPEQTIVWEEGDVLCKMRTDYLHDDLTAAEDLKTTDRSAAPEQFSRTTVFSLGLHIQAAFYMRGIRSISGRDATIRFVVVETQPPYAVAPFDMSPATLALANQRIDFALGIWRDCLKRNHWPAYPTRVMTVEPPPWEEARMYEREYREEAAA